MRYLGARISGDLLGIRVRAASPLNDANFGVENYRYPEDLHMWLKGGCFKWKPLSTNDWPLGVKLITGSMHGYDKGKGKTLSIWNLQAETACLVVARICLATAYAEGAHKWHRQTSAAAPSASPPDPVGEWTPPDVRSSTKGMQMSALRAAT